MVFFLGVKETLEIIIFFFCFLWCLLTAFVGFLLVVHQSLAEVNWHLVKFPPDFDRTLRLASGGCQWLPVYKRYLFCQWYPDFIPIKFHQDSIKFPSRFPSRFHQVPSRFHQIPIKIPSEKKNKRRQTCRLRNSSNTWLVRYFYLTFPSCPIQFVITRSIKGCFSMVSDKALI